jgi:hypothetical protein
MVVNKQGNSYYLNNNKIKNGPGLFRSHRVLLPNGGIVNSSAFYRNENSPLMMLENFNKRSGRIQRHYGVIMNNTSRLTLISNNDKIELMRYFPNNTVKKIQSIRRGSVLRKKIAKNPRTVMKGLNRELNKKIEKIPANLPPNFIEMLRHKLANNILKKAKVAGKSLYRS